MKNKALKRIDTMMGKVQDLWSIMPAGQNTQCQTIMRELESLRKNIESGWIKFDKR